MVGNLRAAAAGIILKLLECDGSLTGLLSRERGRPDYALLQETCFGVCRWQPQLAALTAQLLRKPVKERDRILDCLLWVGLYQLRSLQIADYAVINETVAATRLLQRPWARGLVNAVLRNYQRQREQLEAGLQADAAPAIRFAHPAWLVETLQSDWPDQAEILLRNNNLRPPLTLRVNRRRCSREQYLQQLVSAGIEARAGSLSDSAVYLERAVPVEQLPGFNSGEVSVQDEASQLVPGLLQLQPGQRVLDACAAPGGKTCHIAESEDSLTSVSSIEMEPGRACRIEENLARLQLQAQVVIGDASQPQLWWDQQAFDRILLDAPCSATGVIRRHPDIKLLRQAQDVNKLSTLQLTLLEALWACLKPGGILLYTTCSLLRQENEVVVGKFVEHSQDAKHDPITADWGVECRYGRQLLTGAEDGTDGFYFARLRKAAAN